MEGSEPSKSKRMMVQRAVRWAAVVTGCAGGALLGMTAKGVGGNGSLTHATLGRASLVLFMLCAVSIGALCIVKMIAPPPATAVEQKLRQELRDHQAREAAQRQDIEKNLALLAELTSTIEQLQAEAARRHQAAEAERVQMRQLHDAQLDRVYRATGQALSQMADLERQLVDGIVKTEQELVAEMAEIRSAVEKALAEDPAIDADTMGSLINIHRRLRGR